MYDERPLQLERFLLSVVMSLTEEREALAALWIVNWLLSRSNAFNARIAHLVAHVPHPPSPPPLPPPNRRHPLQVPAAHYALEDTTEKLKAYYAAFPVKSWAIMHLELGADPRQPQQPHLPIYFAHLGLSLLPVPTPSLPTHSLQLDRRVGLLQVADLVVQKMLELPTLTEALFQEVLESLAPIYKFHPQPGFFLASSLLYYESTLKDHPHRRRYLVLKISGQRACLLPFPS